MFGFPGLEKIVLSLVGPCSGDCTWQLNTPVLCTGLCTTFPPVGFAPDSGPNLRLALACATKKGGAGSLCVGERPAAVVDIAAEYYAMVEEDGVRV